MLRGPAHQPLLVYLDVVVTVVSAVSAQRTAALETAQVPAMRRQNVVNMPLQAKPIVL